MLFSKVSETSQIIENVWENEDFADVTLATSDDHQIKAHKLVLSANSSFFRNIFLKNQEQNLLIHLMGVRYSEMYNLLRFMYLGNCDVEEGNVDFFLTLAKLLRVNGLDVHDSMKVSKNQPEAIGEYTDKNLTTLETGISNFPNFFDRSNDLREVKYKAVLKKQKLEDREPSIVMLDKNHSGRLDTKDIFEDSNYINKTPEDFLANSNKPKEHLINTIMVKHENKEGCSEIKSQKLSLSSEAGEISKPRILFCRLCKDKFDNKEQAQRHQQIHKKLKRQSYGPYLCDQCDRKYTQGRKLREHIEKFHEEKLHKCDQCDKGFTTLYAMRKHKRRAHREKLYCSQCDANFRLEGALNSHIELQHKGSIGRYDCHDCDKSYSVLSNLTAHINVVHKGLNNKCDKCDEVFTSQKNLHTHKVAKHVGKSFFCHLCSTSFLWQKNLETHIGAKHEGKKINCEECSSSFSYRSHLINHNKLKHPECTTIPTVKCSQCTKEFKREKSLTTHIKHMHEGTPGKYDCDQCDKNYEILGTLETHKKSIHKGIRYQCTICDSSHTEKYRLNRHIRLKHTESLTGDEIKTDEKEPHGNTQIKVVK